jgi:hypothetical protein
MRCRLFCQDVQRYGKMPLTGMQRESIR